MGRFMLGRIAHGILVILGVVFAVSSLIHLVPGDPVKALEGESPLPREQLEIMRRSMGLDRPVIVQLLDQAGKFLHGDLGRSLRSRRLVADDLRRVVPSTVALAISAMLLGTFIGLPVGVLAAMHRGRWLDSSLTGFAVVGVSMPTFWIGILLISLFSVHLGWFPTSGQVGIRTLVLPAITLGWYPAGALARLIRSEMLEVLQQEYVGVARAKGLSERVVVLRHALGNALIPTVTLATIQFGILLSGAVIVETVFARNGLGRFLVDGILHKDFPVIQGAVLVVAVVYTSTNLLTDLIYGYIDPRIRFD